MEKLVNKLAHVMAGIVLILPATGYSVNFAQQPLAVGNAVEPNVLFVIDDSGSMGWEYMPDTIGNRYGADRTCIGDIEWWGGCDGYWEYDGETADNRWYYSGVENTVYYNPDITYSPPQKSDNSGRYANSSFNSAYTNGYAQSGSRNLANDFRHRGLRFEEPFYYEFDSDSQSCLDDARQNVCYTYVSVNDLSSAEKQNFANWYSFYRTRMYASRAGIGEAFSELENNFRLGWGRINKNASSVDGSDDVRAVVNGVRSYDSDHKEDFYDFLYAAPTNGGTPLRRALEGAGQYYETSARSWADNPGESVHSVSNPERECRLAYTILMTDGFWNGSAPSDSIGNADSDDGDTITGPNKSFKYEAGAPFEDGYSNTLADVAMYYWKRDLRPVLPNLVPQTTVTAVPVDEDEDETPFDSPAFWQHMVTYGVGLGVSPSIAPPDAFQSLRTGEAVGNNGWPQPASDSINNIDDLLHAGVNSHGGFFSASDPTTFSDELKKVLAEITKDPGSATSVDVSGETVAEGDLLFAASYDPSNWTGDLKAGSIGTGDNLIPDFESVAGTAYGWSAAAKIDEDAFDPGDRTVITYVAGKSAPFRWDDLGTDQANDLSLGGDATLGEARLGFIRGDQSREGAQDEPSFRKRASRLGSIVNSSPNFVGAPVSGWPDTESFGADDDRYSSYVEDNEDRTPIVYAGANDGMLHGFQATLGANGGKERLAYIPGFLYSTDAYRGLHYLTDPNYGHRYYVDLATRKQDVYTKGRRANNGNATNSRDWRTILVGGARAGAKGVFALDVSNPDSFSEDDAPGLALWEFSASDDNRLGYITQPPVIALSKWGGAERWTVFIANGYSSDNTSTGFFMLDIEGGLDGIWSVNTDYRYVEFENAGDGLSPLTVLDTTGDYMADRIYAGDLDGNIWVATNQSGNWAAAYSDPLFTAGAPVTGAPAVASNKDMPRATNEPNLMVYFGTGKYLETNDIPNIDTQAFFSVWDKGQVNLNSGNLIERVLEQEQREVEGVTQDIRISEGDPVNYTTHYGWFADLTDEGERVVNNPVVRGDYVYINTIIPSSDPCAGGGSGWIMGFGRMGGIVVDNAKAFASFPSDTQGYRTGGMPSQLTVRGDTLLYDESGDDPKAEDLPPLGGDIPGAGRRGWHELVE